MSIVRTDLYDTTPGAKGECAAFAPPPAINTHQLYQQWLEQAVNRTVRARFFHYTLVSYRGSNVFPKPRIEGPFAHVLDRFFSDFVAGESASITATKQKDGPPSEPTRDLFF